MGKRRGGHGGGHGSSERWLLTYADMITLLLALFIVMFAMSNLDAKKLSDLSQSLSSAFHVTSGGSEAVLPPASKDLLDGGGALVMPEQQKLMEMQENLEKALESAHGADAASSITTSVNQRGLVISLANSAFFGSGEASLKPQAMAFLKTVMGVIGKDTRPVMVEGHTDNTPIMSGRYPSNWELSTARSTTVVRTLITRFGVTPRRLSAAGYGEYYPVVSNDSEANRAKNRRVDLVLLRADLAKTQRPGDVF